MGFLEYYNLESYLLDTVRLRFQSQGYLSSDDFFCIVMWKANRSKSRIAKNLMKKGCEDMDVAVRELTAGLSEIESPKDRLRFLMKDWGFRLPMATAVLTILYPDEFTVYDKRACDALGRFHKLKDQVDFGSLWLGYQEFKRTVEDSTPSDLNLRDKDRYLWGKCFYEQLMRDLGKDIHAEQFEHGTLASSGATKSLNALCIL